MKKGLVVLLILAMAGTVVAQEVKVSGGVRAGLNIEQQEGVNNDDAVVKPHNSYTGTPIRAELTVAATYDNYGAQLRFRSKEGDVPELNHAFVWGEFLNDAIKLTAGKIGNAAWNTDATDGTSGDGFNYAAVNGVRFEFKPLAGLNFGFGLDAGSAPLTVGQFFKETVLGVKYTSDLFNAALAIKLDSDADDGGSDKEAKLLFGFKLNAIPALKAVVEGQLTSLGNDDDAVGVGFVIHEDLGFQISDPFEVHLYLTEEGNLGETKDSYIYIRPGLSYEVLPSVSLWAGLNFGISTVEDSPIQIGITPGVTYSFSDTAAIDAWYTATVNKDFIEDAKLHNSIQIDFTWSF